MALPLKKPYYVGRSSWPPMDSGVWSQLPQELFLLIMLYDLHNFKTVRDKYSLRSKWISIAYGNRYLHRAYLSHLWEEVDIYWDDLRLSSDTDKENSTHHPDPNTDTQKYEKLIQRLNNNKHDGLVQELLAQYHGICPAQFVRNLNLVLGQVWQERKKYSEPSHVSLEYTLELIFPWLKSVRSIRVDGPPSSAIFGAIAQLEPTQLQALQIGARRCDYYFRNTVDNEFHDKYDWTKLEHLTGLTELKIMQLAQSDVRSLAQLIPKLSSLRTLTLAARRSHHTYDEGMFESTAASPLQTLLYPAAADRDDTANLLTQLPASLTKLEIRDHWYPENTAVHIPRSKDHIHQAPSSCYLKTFHGHLDGLEQTYNVLTWLPNARLEHIALLPVLAYHDNSPDKTDRILHLIDKILNQHVNTLRTITFINIWKIVVSLVPNFTARWSPHFKLTDLVLGSNHGPSESCAKKQGHLGPQNHFKHALLGCSNDTGQWGPDLQRLQVEGPLLAHYAEFGHINVRIFDNMPKLRVLLISPRQKQCEKVHGYTPDDHKEILLDLLKQTSPTLRFVQLCEHQYWIDYREGEEPNIVDWWTAYRGWDRRLTNGVAAWLTPEDREFLKLDSWINSRDGALPVDWLPPDRTIAQNPPYPAVSNFAIARSGQ